MVKRISSDFLFAQPSFASGAARVFDLWGKFDEYNQCETAEKADGRAIASDWLVVGQDLSDALKQNHPNAQVG